jgi:hypothetical protein
MAPLVTIGLEANPTLRSACKKGLINMLWVNALPVLLQLRNDLVVIVP